MYFCFLKSTNYIALFCYSVHSGTKLYHQMCNGIGQYVCGWGIIYTNQPITLLLFETQYILEQNFTITCAMWLDRMYVGGAWFTKSANRIASFWNSSTFWNKTLPSRVQWDWTECMWVGHNLQNQPIALLHFETQVHSGTILYHHVCNGIGQNVCGWGIIYKISQSHCFILKLKYILEQYFTIKCAMRLNSLCKWWEDFHQKKPHFFLINKIFTKKRTMTNFYSKKNNYLCMFKWLTVIFFNTNFGMTILCSCWLFGSNKVVSFHCIIAPLKNDGCLSLKGVQVSVLFGLNMMKIILRPARPCKLP